MPDVRQYITERAVKRSQWHYDALRAGGVPDDKAREAAEEVATYEKDLAEIKSDVRLLKWITGTTLAGVLALVIRTFTS
jgi:hypothetical protein